MLKVKGQNFHAFSPSGKAGTSDVEIHFSRHESGLSHMVAKRYNGKEWIEDKWPRLGHDRKESMRRQTTAKRPPIDELRGAELFYGASILCGQFSELEQVGTSVGELILLDAESRGFRDDFTAVRAYLVEADREDAVPFNEYAGSRILHFVKRTTPWVAIEVFQQKAEQES